MKDVRKDHARLLKNLRLLQRLYSADALMQACGIKRATWYNKMREPWRKFSYDDFVLISQYCRIDFATLICGELKIR